IEQIDACVHLERYRSGNDHDIRLTRRSPESPCAEAIEVIPGCARGHHFDRAARKTEGHGPERPGTRPVEKLVQRGDDDVVFELSFQNSHALFSFTSSRAPRDASSAWSWPAWPRLPPSPSVAAPWPSPARD